MRLHSFLRYGAAGISLLVAFVLSVQFSDRGPQFDLRQATVEASETRGKVDGYDLSALQILNRVLLQITDNYVEPERIEPAKMLVSALDSIQNNVPEVVFRFDGDKERDPRWIEAVVHDQTKRFDTTRVESLWEMSFRLKEILHFVQGQLTEDEDLKFRDIEYAAISGLLTTLDPHSALLTPDSYSDMQTQTGGRFGGLGIVISIRDGELTVISPIDGTPASKKGIRARDVITRIGEHSTVNMNLSEAVNMLRGEPGTDVEIWIMRQGWSEPRKYSVTRAEIRIESVDSKPLGNRIGYLRIKNFQANTTADLRKNLADLKEKMGGINGLILDMRDNPGGLLDQSIQVSDVFLDKGVIVSTVGVGNRMRDQREARARGTEPDYPIIVLVNAGSASASEIVAGALQNHNRAIVLGDTTFGKGTVQMVYEFPDDSALKLTVAQYLTPGGISIQSEGISPDLRALPVRIRENRVDMFFRRHSLREQDLTSHLTNTAAQREAGNGIHFVRYLSDEPDEDDDFQNPDEFREDFEIRLAQRLLARAGSDHSRNGLMKSIQPELQNVLQREGQRISSEFRKIGIDWTEGATVSKPELDVELRTNLENNRVAAGEKLTITASVTNRGPDPIYQLKGITRADLPMLDDREFIFGLVNPGQTRSFDIHVDIPKDTGQRKDLVRLHLSDGGTEFSEPTPEILIETDGAARPLFGFSYWIEDDSRDGVLTNGESAKLHVEVTNIGNAASGETMVYLKNRSKQAVYLTHGRSQFSGIEPGKSESVSFEFEVRGVPETGRVELELDIFDSNFRELTQKKFSIPYAMERRVAEAATGFVTFSANAKVFAAAHPESDIAAQAKRGQSAEVTAQVSDWWKIKIGERHGWVQKNLVEHSGGQPSGTGNIAPFVMHAPPKIELHASEMITTRGTVNLRGKATDDLGVRDYYVMVFNREKTTINTRKLNYVSGAGNEMDIRAEVPLFPGMNRIAVIARDQDGLTSTRSVYVYRRVP